MRLLFGMILGAALTVGGAYVSDTATKSTSAEQRPMVNWDVVEANWNSFKAQLQTGFADLRARINRA